MAAEKIDALELDINSKLDTANLDKVIDKLGELEKALNRLKSKTVTVNIKEVGEASATASTGVDKLTNSFLNQAVKITALIAVYRRLSGVISDGIADSMTYIKTLNMFNVSLGDYAENASKYAYTVRDAMGIDVAGWQKAQGIFETLIKGFGVGGDQAAYMSQQLTQLSYDIASYYDLTTEEAQNKVKAALSGRIEPIRKLGWDISQGKLVDIASNPENYGIMSYAVDQETGALIANTQAVDDNTEHKIVNFNQLTQAEKVQLRYIALMTEVTEVQGNMGKTLRDPANQMKIFNEQSAMTGRALGNIFIPAINEVLPYLTAFFNVLEDGFQEIARFFGFEIPDMSDRIGVADEVDYYDDIVEATGNAAGNAKKLKDYMIGIDELNVLRPDDGTSRGSGLSGEQSDLTGLIVPGYDFLTAAIESRIKEAKENLEKLFADWKEHPLEVPIDIFVRGAGEIGQGFWTWALGKTPDELAEEAEQNGQTIGQAFWSALFTSPTGGFKDIWTFILGKTPEELAEESEATGKPLGYHFILGFWNNSPLGKVSNSLPELITGKTPEELAQDADKSGKTIGKEFFSSFMLASPWVTHAASMQSAWEVIFGLDSTVEQRAKESGHTLGEQFVGEFARTLLEIVTSNPVLQWFYETGTGRSAETDLENLKKKLLGSSNKDYQKTNSNTSLGNTSLGNTSADEARKRGEEAAKGYSEGWEKTQADLAKTGNAIYNTIWKGVTNNGSDLTNFYNRSSKVVSNYADGLINGKSKVEGAGRGIYSTAYNSVTNYGNADTAFYNTAHGSILRYIDGLLSGKDSANTAGSTLYSFAYSGVSDNGKSADNYGVLADKMAELFASNLGSKKNTDNAYDSGVELSEHGVLGAWAYKDEFYDAGSNSGEGFINGIKDWIDEAEDAGKTVGDSVLEALRDAIKEGSPSKETEKSGMYFDLGFAKGIEEYASKASDAADTMARAAVKATNGDMFNNLSVAMPKSNIGYGIGAMNEGAMATLASNIYQAVVSGMAAVSVADNNKDFKVIIDGKEIFKVVQKQARDRGAEISNGAFSR